MAIKGLFIALAWSRVSKDFARFELQSHLRPVFPLILIAFVSRSDASGPIISLEYHSLHITSITKIRKIQLNSVRRWSVYTQQPKHNMSSISQTDNTFWSETSEYQNLPVSLIRPIVWFSPLKQTHQCPPDDADLDYPWSVRSLLSNLYRPKTLLCCHRYGMKNDRYNAGESSLSRKGSAASVSHVDKSFPREG